MLQKIMLQLPKLAFPSRHNPKPVARARRPNARRRAPSVRLFLACLFAMGGAAAAQSQAPLRLCADPENLPFTSQSPQTPGLYREIGDAIAAKLNRPATYVWYRTYFGKRALRTTLLAGQCDLEVGFPLTSDFMGPRLIFSKPIMDAGYAIVTRKPLKVTSIEELKGRTVAVQFATTPHNILAQSGVTTVTSMSPEEALKTLADGKADAAFVWGPVAGYLNKTTFSDSLNLTDVDGPGLRWPVAVVFAKSSAKLRDEVDAAIEQIRPVIDTLKAKYGVDSVSPIKFGEAKTDAPSLLIKVVDGGAQSRTEEPQSQTKSAALGDTSPKPSEPANADTASLVEKGRELFNGTCAHCHGPDAVQSVRKIDLRLLHRRYKEKLEEVYTTTVMDGRPAKGMPTWKEVYTPEQIATILAYLKTVQTKEQ